MGAAMAAQDIGGAWLAFVTDTFLLEDGIIRREVQDEYTRIESTDTFARTREAWRVYTDTLIDRILQSPQELRPQLLTATDHRSLAYVQDRIHCGTELLTALAQKGLQINVDGAESLPEFFRQILMQKPV